MILYNGLIDIFFRLFNFMILVALGAYFFYTQAYPSLKKKVADWFDGLRAMHTESQQYRERYTQEQIKTQQAHEQADYLEKQMEQWVAAVELAHHVQQQEQKEREIHIRQRMEKRSLLQAQRAVLAMAVPAAVGKAHAAACARYADLKQVKEYQTVLVRKLDAHAALKDKHA